MEFEELVKRVAEGSSDAKGKMMKREDVEQVVVATLTILNDATVDTTPVLPALVSRDKVLDAIRV